MPRRRKRSPIPVTLVLPAEPPAQDEINAILMAADAIVGAAGRSGLTLILNGSRSKKALEWEWDQLPDYGALQHLTAEQIARKVDWCIYHHWLRIEYDRDVPLLYHSPQGWERVKALWVERLLGWFEEWQAPALSSVEGAGQPDRVWPRLETIHRDIKLLLLQAIEQRQRRDLAPMLRTWFAREVRKLRTAINHTLHTLGEQPLPHPDRPAQRK